MGGRLRRERFGAVVPVRNLGRGRSRKSAAGGGRVQRRRKDICRHGIDFADYDNDSHPDIIVTDLSNERYRLFRHNGDGNFRDATNASGVGGATLPFSGWSTRFFDYDNDGWKDLFVAQGHVMDTIEKTSPNLRYLQPPLLLRNESGRFVRVLPGDVFRKDWAGRGAAFGDLDNDGDVDVVVGNDGQKALVLKNEGGNRQNWIGLRLVGQRSNRDGIGSQVKVVAPSGATQHFTVTTAVDACRRATSGSSSDSRIRPALRGSRSVGLRVSQRLENVKAGQTIVITEGTK